MATALALSTPAASDTRSHASTPAIEGTWLVKVVYHYPSWGYPDDQIQYLQHFGRDGRAVIYLPRNRQDPWDEARTASVGEWKPRRGHSYDLTL